MRIEIESLTKRYGGQVVLEIDRFACEFQHCLALIGPSGGGKSTLLRILGGLEVPDQGSVRLDGEALIWEDRMLMRHRRSIGTVFQAFNLFPHFNALENVVLPLERVHRVPTAEAKSRATEILRRFGLGEHLHKRPAELSGGQRQRVAIARAVAIRPRFLLLDEPTSALDPEMTAEVLEVLDELRQEGRPIILVTHEIAFARHAADRVAFLREGRLEAEAASFDFFANPPTPQVGRFLEKTMRFIGGPEA